MTFCQVSCCVVKSKDTVGGCRDSYGSSGERLTSLHCSVLSWTTLGRSFGKRADNTILEGSRSCLRLLRCNLSPILYCGQRDGIYIATYQESRGVSPKRGETALVVFWETQSKKRKKAWSTPRNRPGGRTGVLTPYAFCVSGLSRAMLRIKPLHH